jgi:hypothetical protein
MSPVVVTSAWTSPTPATRNELVDKVCRLYGVEAGKDAELATNALSWLDEAVDDLNLGLYEFNKVIQTGIVMTASQPYITLATDFYRESQAYLVRTSDGLKYAPLTYLNWVDFRRIYPNDKVASIPFVYSCYNYDTDSQRIYLYYTPSTDVASGYTLTTEYYRRVPRISTLGGGDSLQVPGEVETPIRYGAYKRAAMHFGQTTDVGMYGQLESQALERLKRVDRMHPDARKRFKLVDVVPGSINSRPWGGLWLKLD